MRAALLSLAVLAVSEAPLAAQDYVVRLDPSEADGDAVSFGGLVRGRGRTLLELARSTWSVPGHPLGAEFWSAQLDGLSVADRDLAWSEHVRDHAAVHDLH